MVGRDGGGWVGSERDEKLRCGRSEEVERGKSSVRSTIFPSRRAVTFYLASFGECSDWSVEKEISFFLRGEGNARSFALLVQRSRSRHRLDTSSPGCSNEKKSKTPAVPSLFFYVLCLS